MIALFSSKVSSYPIMQQSRMMKYSKKICLVGEFSVGKTSLVRRFVTGRFDDSYLSTIGAKVSRKTVETERSTFDFYIWDLAGGKDFEHVMESYYSGAAGALIVCDLTRHETLSALTRFAELLRAQNPAIELVFVGNKVDLEADQQIDEASMRDAAERFLAPYILTSAKNGDNVLAAFQQLAVQLEGQQDAT